MFFVWFALGLVARDAPSPRPSGGASLPNDALSLVQRLHEQPSPRPSVLYVTGGGTQLVPWLLCVPGASRTVLEVQVPYAQRSFDQLTGEAPEQYCSAGAARLLAEAAFRRACELVDGGSSGGDCVGLGCTAVLRSEPPKRGQHRCFVAVHSAAGVRELELTLAKDAGRSRVCEDEVVSRCALLALAAECGLDVPGAEFWRLDGDEDDAAAAAEPEQLALTFTPHPGVSSRDVAARAHGEPHAAGGEVEEDAA